MRLKVYGYVSTQFKRHGVKSEADKKAQTAAVKNQLHKFLATESSTESSKEEAKAKTSKPYGSNPKGTNTYYYMKGESFTLDAEDANYSAQKAEWESVITRLTNIATRLEAKAQFDISGKKEAYKKAKDEAFAEIMGDSYSVSLDAGQKRLLDDKLSSFTFGYYESYVMITVICDEYIDALSHCVQDRSTEDGEYVYHIRSKRIVTAALLSGEDLKNLDKEAEDFVKLLPSKEATRFKTTLQKVVDSFGTVTGYKRILERLE